MREYSFNIAANGLTDDPDSLTGMRYLKNLKPDDGFFVVPALPVMPIGWNAGKQVLRGKGMTLLCTATTVYLVNESNMTLTTLATVEAGGAWHMADFRTVALLANGSSVVAVSGLDGSAVTVRLGTVMDHMDSRLVYGDLDDGINWVGWSAIGGEDIPYLVEGADVPVLILAKNEANKAPMPFRGRVLRILPLRDRFVVYGEDGVIAMRVTGGTYGFDWITGLPSGVGLDGRGAAAGNDDGHVFYGTDGALYRIAPDLVCERVHRGLGLSAPTVSHDTVNGEWWITGPVNAYVLTKRGLGGPIEARVMSVCVMNGVVCGTGTGYPDVIRAEAWSNLFDAGDSAQKRVTYVRVSADGVSGIKVGARIAQNTGVKS